MADQGKDKSRQYLRPMPSTWWLKRPAYAKFMLREVTSAFIAAYSLFLLVLACGASDADGFHRLFEALCSPASVIGHLIVLFFALFHTITFFNLTPRAIVVFVGEDKVPERVIQAVHYAGWAAVSLALVVLALIGS